ncbi:MAG: universal stress protein [candidate division WOR-3 bacterium]|jgi:nucleotide-binding universal stress UspA family protein
MDKVLLYIVSGETRASWNRAIEISKGLSATLYALFVVDKDIVKTVSNLRKADEIDTAIKIEEEGWKYLYYLEDMAVNEGVKTALFVEEGDTIDILRKFVKEKKIELLIIGHRRGQGIEGRREERMVQQLIEYVQCPILIDKEGGK